MNDVVHHKFLIAFLLLTAALCGALIMVVEVLGSRVIGPFFGVSLFVWTSLITVTLIALAAGYGFGGYLSDRRPSPVYLFVIILIAGILVVAIPYLKGPVLKACVTLGLRTGSFASTLILFGPALFLLGCVSPYLVKIIARELHSIGRVVGGLYSLSTLGSIIGTILTGFVLIAYLGVDRIFHITGLLLIGLSVAYFVYFEKKWWTIPFLAIPLVAWPGDKPVSVTMKDGTRATLIHKQDSHYGNLKVVDYTVNVQPSHLPRQPFLC